MTLLPLFPLSTVLAPGAQLPLRVFETRYVAMLRDIAGDEGDPRLTPREFGVIALKRGREVGGEVTELHTMGCRARMIHLATSADGTFEVIVIGTERFRVRAIDGGQTPYLLGEVDKVTEAESSVPTDDLVDSVIASLSQWCELVRLEPTEAPPRDPRQLSYWLIDGLMLEVADRQRLLEAPDDGARLGLGHSLLRREIALAEALGAIAPTPFTDPPSAN